MSQENPIRFSSDKRARLATGRRRSIEEGIFNSFENGNWFQPIEESRLSKFAGSIFGLTLSLKNGLSQFQPEGMHLRAKLDFVENLARQEGAKHQRTNQRRRSWTWGYEKSVPFLRGRLKEAYFGTDDPRLLLPSDINEIAQTVANTIGRTFAWERTYDLDPFYDKKNPYMPFIRLYQRGVAEIKFMMVEEAGKVTDEKIIIHAPAHIEGEVKFACITEGDRQVFYNHGFSEKCSEAKPLRPDAPERYIY